MLTRNIHWLIEHVKLLMSYDQPFFIAVILSLMKLDDKPCHTADFSSFSSTFTVMKVERCIIVLWAVSKQFLIHI